MPWPKGMARVEDSDTVRPTAMARVIYAKLQEYAEKSGDPLRGLMERAVLEFLERDGDD